VNLDLCSVHPVMCLGGTFFPLGHFVLGNSSPILVPEPFLANRKLDSGGSGFYVRGGVEPWNSSVGPDNVPYLIV